MAKSGGSRRGAPRPARRTPAKAAPAKRAPRPSAPAPIDTTPRTFTLGAVPGTTPGTWISRWRERLPHVTLELVPLAAEAAARAVREGEVDAALARLPLDDDALHVIPLYEEVTVAVVGAESHLTAADELRLADLAGEIVIVPADDVIGASVPDAAAPRFSPPATTEEAIATVAAGVGVVIVPMSLARLHHRRDVEHRPLVDAPTSRVALAWPREATTPDVETFVGIVRGRTANSSR